MINRWWGFFLYLHTMINYNIYTIVYLMKMGSKRRHYIPLPLQQHCPQCFTKLNKNDTLVPPSMLRRIKQKWMCQSHRILQLPCSLFKTVVLPLHLYLPYGSVMEHYELLVEDAHWLDLEISLRFCLNHIPIYHMVMIMYIFLKQRNMKNIMISSASRKCKSICN